MVSYINKYKVGIVIFISILIYTLPYFVFGTNCYVFAHDNLDGMVPMFKYLSNSGYLFAGATKVVPNYMHGLPRAAYGTEFNIQYLYYYFLSGFDAYVLNVIVVHSLATVGCWLLLKNYWLNGFDESRIVLISLCFGLLHFWYGGGISIAGQPLVVYAFYNIYYMRTLFISVCILSFYICYSMFFWAGIFFAAFLFFVFLVDVISFKRIHYPIAISVLFFIALFLLSEHKLLYSLYNDSFEIHRKEFKKTYDEKVCVVINGAPFYRLWP